MNLSICTKYVCKIHDCLLRAYAKFQLYGSNGFSYKGSIFYAGFYLFIYFSKPDFSTFQTISIILTHKLKKFSIQKNFFPFGYKNHKAKTFLAKDFSSPSFKLTR